GLKMLLRVSEQRFRFWFRLLVTLLALRMLFVGGWSLVVSS
ncbi:MAG: sulfite exporter TauE/SafE family protein, partial [Gammaproteobacteria bacterium]|nr:sulfite exporter TauE/SafE family protein [Gammaproteobacteria bacterium]